MLFTQHLEPHVPQVSLRRLDVRMPQHLLQDVDIHAVRFAEGGRCVTEDMGAAAFAGNAGQFGNSEDRALHCIDGQRRPFFCQPERRQLVYPPQETMVNRYCGG